MSYNLQAWIPSQTRKQGELYLSLLDILLIQLNFCRSGMVASATYLTASYQITNKYFSTKHNKWISSFMDKSCLNLRPSLQNFSGARSLPWWELNRYCEIDPHVGYE